MARQSSTNFLKVDALKNSWVMMKSAPASTFSLQQALALILLQSLLLVIEPEMEKVLFIALSLRMAGGIT